MVIGTRDGKLLPEECCANEDIDESGFIISLYSYFSHQTLGPVRRKRKVSQPFRFGTVSHIKWFSFSFETVRNRHFVWGKERNHSNRSGS